MNTNQKTLKMVQTAILAAIIIVMAFTPLGYLKVGTVEITFITIPVVIGAMVAGPVAGAVLGGIFGITSFIQCFGMSAFGTTLFGINPIYTFILCVVTRILVGWLSGLLFKAISGKDKTKVVSCIVTSGFGAIINTALFIVTLFLLFGRTEFVQSLGGTFMKLAIAIVGLNGVIEAAVGLVLGSVISKLIFVLINDKRISTNNSAK